MSETPQRQITEVPISQTGELIRNPQISDQERIAVAVAWMKKFYYFRENFSGRDREMVDTIFAFADEHVGIGIPVVTLDKVWGIKQYKAPDNGNEDWFIVPLFESDKDLHPYFASLTGRASASRFARAIYIPNTEVNPLWQSMLLYHELTHLYHWHVQSPQSEDQDERRWVEEYDTYLDEIRLTKLLYGQPYNDAVKVISKRYEKELRKGALTIYRGKDISEEELEHIFGKSLSLLEYSSQRGVMQLDALYRALDRIHTDGIRQEHYAITKWFYNTAEVKTFDRTARANG